MSVCKIKYSIALLALAMLFQTGCLKDSFTDGSNDLLRFRCDSIATRSAGFTQSGQNAILSMGVYAAHTSGNWSVDAQLDFMQNRNVMRADDSSPWEYSPEGYWPGSGMVTFFAYAPHNAAGLTLTGTQGIPQMQFTVDSDPATQVDLLVASPLKDYTKTSSQGNAEFTLRHALTRISFAAKLAGSPSDDVRITGIKVSNLYNTGSCPMDGGGRKWTLPGGAKAEASYSLSNAVDGGLKDAALTNEYETVTTADGNLFLLPQTLTDDAVLDISYTKNGKVGIPAKIKLSDALAMWQPGEAIRFLINLTATDPDLPFDVELSYTFVNWDNVSTDVEIDNDPFLTVTDVVTSSYDAAVTRVYFYTNQPAASVFIDPVGRVSSLAGATMNVKDEFYGIAPDDPDTTDGFFFDATSSKGYFDLINRNTTTAGNVQNKGKQSLILNLHAGKLHRYITVNPVVTVETAKQNSERYVGTFHRRNEMGERIVTWHLDKEISWTATIDESVGNHEHLVIDRMASPDYKDNLMYSLTPRAAEGAKVEPETTVSGKGRVYFRVGWKTTSLSANRYARIKVTYSGAGAPLTEDYIYCRQGEDPDQLNTALNTANFTVYNIASDGVFVEYPSQGGFIAQWGRPRMWPLIGSGVPGGYPDVLFDEALDPNINICPERHTYPDQDVIDALKNSYTYLQPKWGYYADGYFDRRAVVNNRADNSSVNVASAGILLSLEQNSRSVFLPTAGYRDEMGVLKGVGTTSGYWTQVEDVADAGGKKYNAVALWLYDGSTVSDVKGYDKRNSLFMRCVKIENAIVIYFDANGGENAPRSVSASANSNVHIPNKIPGNYWKDGYLFDGWNTKKDGSGTKVNPGDSYAVGSADHTLYAKWIVDPYIKVNFRAYMTAEQQTKYLLAKGQSYELYEIGSNGTKLTDGFYQSADVISADNEMAFPNLEFHKDINADANWTNAYSYCKSLADGGYKWRLPRAMEFMLVSMNSPVAKLKKPEINNGKYLWAGTELDNAKAYSFLNVTIMLNSYNKTEMRPFRCVREIKE